MAYFISDVLQFLKDTLDWEKNADVLKFLKDTLDWGKKNAVLPHTLTVIVEM